ncbi:hypothetical protein HN51_013935 [Arachis hypogaea]|uniref:Uncharacterized protein n=1 Tax=Arachis hypogaea TaxID=3818 RepID=A0A445DN55_ARAHY|nr:uncharacterized protein LOC112735601 [Arachis hypogaea]QHO59779.1 uncharacterized protein DS421_3g101870 [Arachis hypogaea]RYR64604.1 hypothetical protein Ahy_A03g010681 [Arachis hypogaea]
MEDLISQFTFLSNQALQERSSDPSTSEDLMRLFEIESYRAWAGVELIEQENKEVQEEKEAKVTTAMQQDNDHEDYLECVMESAIDELRCFEEELKRMSQPEMDIASKSILRMQ